MGMNTHVIGFKPPDEKWRAMKRIWDACVAAKVSVPLEVAHFFGSDREDPSDAGVEVELEGTECCRVYERFGASGLEIDITKLPADVKIVRFYNSW